MSRNFVAKVRRCHPERSEGSVHALQINCIDPRGLKATQDDSLRDMTRRYNAI